MAAAALDPRRAQAEAVQRMVEEKRRAAAAARKPFLVVHPGEATAAATGRGQAHRTACTGLGAPLRVPHCSHAR